MKKYLLILTLIAISCLENDLFAMKDDNDNNSTVTTYQTNSGVEVQQSSDGMWNTGTSPGYNSSTDQFTYYSSTPGDKGDGEILHKVDK